MNFITTFSCQQLFQNSDFHSNKITLETFESHHTADNAWIAYQNYVFSIQKDDEYLLDLFRDYYGKDVKKYIQSFTKATQKEIYEKLRPRYIGNLITS